MKHPLYTIGHGTRPAETFLELLLANGIQYLADVRSKPYSRFNPQYNRERLQSFLAAAGIRYVFMGDSLGGRPNDPLCYDNFNRVDYDRVQTMDFFKAGIARLKIAYSKDIQLAIMCSESKPLECHRTHLISKVLVREGLKICHIDETGKLISQNELIKDQP